jgi:transglutaminase-like putative cysteine protease
MISTDTPNTPTEPFQSASDPAPSSAQERVTVGASAEWVTVRPLNETVDPSIPGGQVVLMIDRQYRVIGNERYERIARLLKTVQAVHEAAQWRLDFDPATQRVVIHSIGVRRAGQFIEQAELSRLRFLHREENLDRFVVDGRITVVVLIEDVRVGDIIDVSYTIQTTPRLLPENFWLFNIVPAQIYIRAFHLSVRYPDQRAIRWKHSEDEYTPVFKKYDGESEWQWKLEEIRPREIEPGVPGWHFVNPWFQVSDCASWAVVADGVSAAWVENFHEPEFIEIANEIASSAATPAERANRAIIFIQDEVRYLSLNSGLGGQIPASPGTVLRRRFGDCKDKSFLAAHLLRRLGIPARAVLVNSALRQSVDRLLPMPDAFDHVVVEYEISGKRRWVDVTVPMQGGNAISRAVSDFRTGLPVGSGIADLERIASITSLGDIYELRETFMLDTAGRPSALKVMVKAAGAEADTLRREFALEGAEEVARKREIFYKQFFPDLRRVAVLEWRDERAGNEFVIAEMYEMRSATVPGREAQTCVFEYRSHLIQAVLGFSDTGVRKQPFAVRYPCQLHHWIEVESPALEGAPPQTTAGRDAAFRFSCDFNRQYGKIIVHYSLRTLADSVKPERFEQFKSKIREIWPTTFLHVALPLGVIMSRRNRAAGNLLPVVAPQAKRKPNVGKSSEPDAPPEPKPADFSLPSEPAAAVFAGPGVSVETADELPQDNEQPFESAPMERRTNSARSSAAVTDFTASGTGSRGKKRKRRRSHSSPWKKGILIGIYVLLGLAALYFLIILNLRKN